MVLQLGVYTWHMFDLNNLNVEKHSVKKRAQAIELRLGEKDAMFKHESNSPWQVHEKAKESADPASQFL